MTDKTRIKIAAIVTALFLAGISTAGLALHNAEPTTAATPAPAAAVIPQPAAAPIARTSGDDEKTAYQNKSREEHDADD
ncbi:MAG TPA: hypothetical protein VJ608_06030 [Albitalea sp.]|nr:hypothetical protein [Albitalea sp.]